MKRGSGRGGDERMRGRDGGDCRTEDGWREERGERRRGIGRLRFRH